MVQAQPTRPIDWTTPRCRQASWKRAAVYSLPRSVWKIIPHMSRTGLAPVQARTHGSVF